MRLSVGFLALIMLPCTGWAQPGREWAFDVYLDDKHIGEHVFRQTPSKDGYRMDIEATFSTTLFLVISYDYHHRNREQWRQGCLVSIDATTQENDERFFVTGQEVQNEFHVRTHAGEAKHSGCISTFAYWDPNFLTRQQLLNSQTGELELVNIKKIDAPNTGDRKDLKHYRLNGDALIMDLWYDTHGDWIALESPVKGGMRLRYERQSQGSSL